jgi:hypothetical protein
VAAVKSAVSHPATEGRLTAAADSQVFRAIGVSIATVSAARVRRVPPDPPAHLAPLLVDALRQNRRLRWHVAYACEQRAARRDAPRVAVALLADKDRQLDRARSTLQAWRDELRRYTSVKVQADADSATEPPPRAPIDLHVRGALMGRGKAQRSLDLIDHSIAILREIQPTSVRAVCFRQFTAGAITSMAKGESNKSSRHLTYAREEGLVPWDWIVDEMREPERLGSWADPAAFVEAVKRSYRRDRWTDQPVRLEVWSEKGTIRGTLAPELHDYGVTFRLLHGFGSSTAVHQVAVDSLDSAKVMTALYVGDWDPSGFHMRLVDLQHRLEQYDGDVEIVRVAFTKDDILSGLPSFATDTKRGDPRYRWYRGQFGARCFELDALSPVVLRDRVQGAILARLDHESWHRSDVAEQAERESLLDLLSKWPTSISRQASEYRGRP